MPFNPKSLISLRSWLFYAEALTLILFITLAFLYIQRSTADPESSSISEIGTFIEKADDRFEEQDLVEAALYYWEALRALESVEDTQKVTVDGTEFTPPDLRLRANLRIAQVYLQSSWLKDSKARLEHAARIQPEHPGVRLLRGKIYRDEGEQEAAVQELLAVLKNAPDSAEANYLLGVLYQGSKQFEQAAEHYAKAIENDTAFVNIPSEKAPIGILARLQLSRTYTKMLQKYRFLDREFTDADLAEVTRLESEAIYHLEDALKHMPEMNEVINDLVGLLFARATALERQDIETRQYVEALQVYERIVELDPQEVRAWERMGEIYASFLGDKEAALQTYRKIYEMEPHPTVLANIKSLEEDIALETAADE